MLTPAFFRFFSDLTKNNAKTWFDENRSRYEHDVKRPFHALVSSWIAAVQSIEPELHATPSDVIYRINRDIRFSADKTPYKLHMAAHLNLRGKKAMGFPGVYMEVGAKGGAIAAGSYMPNKEELPALRDLVLHEGADLRAAISAPWPPRAFRAGPQWTRGDDAKSRWRVPTPRHSAFPLLLSQPP